MELKRKGKYLEIPIIGLSISKIIFDGFISIVFSDPEESYLEFHSNFIKKYKNYIEKINTNTKESLLFFYDQFGQTITEAKTDKYGNLWIELGNGVAIIVEDGPYENWHYTRKSINIKKDNLHIHGGAGSTYW